jgi:hypothetical protein
MASGTIRIPKIYFRDFESNSVTVPAKGRVAIDLGAGVSISGYQMVAWKYVGGSTADMRNRVMVYGDVATGGGGLKLFGTDNSDCTGTVTIRIFYVPNGQMVRF